MPRFHIPLIKPDMQIYRIGLTPVPSSLRIRQVTARNPDVVQTKCLVEILGWEPFYSGSPISRSAHQPAAEAKLRVPTDPFTCCHDRPLIEVAAPTA
jgi:hypothetical protein